MKIITLFATLLSFALSASTYAQTLDKAKLDQFFDRLIEKNKAMGTLTIAKDGKIVYTRSIGYSQINGNEKKPLTAASRYRIASISKMYTAVMIFQLVEERKLKLTETLDKFFPQIANAQKITIAQILAHRSGIHDALLDKNLRPTSGTNPITKDELLAIIAKGTPDFEPDAKHSYSNSGYTILGLIIEKLTGKTYEAALRERITSKIGLRDTYAATRYIDVNKNEVLTYMNLGGNWKQGTETNPSLFFSAGSIISTPNDLAKFIQALFDGKLISPEHLNLMKTIRDGDGSGMEPFSFAGKTFYGHTGGGDNHGAWLAYLPEEKLAVAYTTNAKVWPVRNIVSGVVDIYFNKPFEIPSFESVAVSPEILDRYVGVYSNPEAPVKFTITREGATLFFQPPRETTGVALEATAQNKFKIEGALEIEFDTSKNQMILKRFGNERVFTKENAGAPATSQDKTAAIDKLFSWATASTPGCVCAVSQNGKMIVNRAYGTADLERDVPINTNTIFDAASLSKQFVAAAALLLVEEGKLSLSDDVRKYIPELHDYGHKITIDHLLTHTSGLRDWTSILPISSSNTDAFNISLRQRGLNFVPGEEWAYSNNGFVLMKEIIGRITKMPFGDFVQKRLFDTLGMKSTSYRHDLRKVIKNRALAYERDGSGWRMSVILDNDRGGGGGLMSTASDLLIWNDALTNNRLGKFVSEKLQEPTILNNGRKLNYGRGLFLETYRGFKEIWHTGSAEAYKSWLGRYPEHNLSIAIMCNSGDETDRFVSAHRVFDLFVTAKSTQSTEEGAPPIPQDTAGLKLESKVGLYFSERTGEALHLAADRGRLRVVAGPGFVSLGNDRFKRWGAIVNFMSQDAFELQFLPNGDLELKSMEGKITRYRRARTYVPTAADLQAFVGRYESDEIGTVFKITNSKEGLMLTLEHAAEKTTAIKPVDRDTFQVSRMIIRFERDKKGKVVGIDYSNPVLRNIKFKKIG
jgi:D-alanyl-D-alanine carboxypeptidase